MVDETESTQVQPCCQSESAKTVSIAMATYNGERFLQQQLESLLFQTHPPTELVVQDDCSTDSTLDILIAFQASAPFQVIIKQNESRLGYRMNFMRCVSTCSCDIVAFCDQDDVWDVEKIQESVNALEQSDTTLFFHDSLFIDEDNNLMGLGRINQLPKVNCPGSFYPLKNPFGFSIAFRQELLQFSHLWERSLDTNESGERMAHDQWIFFLASILGTIVCSPLPLVKYRQHGRNLYGWKKEYNYRQHVRDLFTNRGAQYLHFADVTKIRSELAGAVRDMVSGKKAVLAEKARVDYLIMSTLWMTRADIYSSMSVLHRLRVPFKIRRSRGYGKHPWVFGRKQFARDILLSLAHPFLCSLKKS